MRGGKEEQRLAQAYARATTQIVKRRWGIVVGVTVAVSACAHVALILDWFDAWMSEDLQPFLVVVPLVVLLTIGIFSAISFYADVIILRIAIRRLRYGDWDFFAFVVLDRPVRSSMVLQEPGILFLFGHLLLRVGNPTEGKQLIDRAMEQKEGLEGIALETRPSLTAAEEECVLEGLNNVFRRRVILRIWDSPVARYALIIAALVLLAVFYTVHILSAIR